MLFNHVIQGNYLKFFIVNYVDQEDQSKFGVDMQKINLNFKKISEVCLDEFDQQSVEFSNEDESFYDVDFSETILHDNNYKDQILRYFQHNYQLYPTYKTEKNENNKYECKLYKGEEYIVSGYGNSKKKSEQDASKRALIKYHVLSE